MFLMFQELQGPKWKKGKLHNRFFIERLTEGRRSKREEPQGPKEGGPRGQIPWPRGTHQVEPRALPRSGLFNTPSSPPKSHALIFLNLFEVAAAAELLIPSDGGQILLLRSSKEGENHRHRHHLSTLAWEEASTSSPSSRSSSSPSLSL